MEKEIWKDIKGFEGRYQVSNFGNIKSLPKLHKYNRGYYLTKEKILKNNIGQRGYLYVNLSNENHYSKGYQIHRLVAQAFIPNIENKPCVNHIDGNKRNNIVSNLEWCSYLENNIHAYKTGLKENKSRAKIKVAQIKDGNIVATYNSLNSASKITGFGRTTLECAIKGIIKTAYGFEWKRI